MKSFAKVVGIIIAVLAGLGILLVGIGAGFGGTVTIGNGIMSKVQTIIEEQGGLNIKLDNIEGIDFKHNVDILTATEYEAEFSGAEVSSLCVEIGGGSFVMKEHNSSNWKVEAQSVGKYQIYCDNGVLTITAGGKTNTDVGEIIVWMPKNATLNAADFMVGAGEIDIDSIYAKTMEMEVGAGDLNIAGGKIDNLSLEVGMGSADIEAEMNGNVNVEVAMGDVNLIVVGSSYEDHNYEVECAAGEISLGSSSSAGFANEDKIDFNSSSTYTLECALGSVDVEFK